MKKVLIAAALLIGGLVSTAANAMPAASFAPSPTSVVQVDYACGRGFHITQWGDCRPNGWRRPPPRFYGYHRPPPPPQFYGHHRPPPPRHWGHRDWRDDRYGY